MPINCQCNDPSPSNGALMLTQNKIDLMNHRMNKHLKKTGNFVHGIQEHVRIGSKISETVKGKLRLGARILQLGGVSIPLRKIKRANQSENVKNPSQK
ncbi:hypothetical protein CK203_014472 [Vitis vinifera]|uniref:Uncharacterized protein n=1 Tax=Vitis vinifera TaxID=29760 RepID=A0A438K5B7_VITVI|nr:hypothetical protein CK203_084035 [Vitis vinifera]RVX16385.1 hypothetical protein CK203_014472 [Vitis vinifera]